MSWMCINNGLKQRHRAVACAFLCLVIACYIPVIPVCQVFLAVPPSPPPTQLCCRNLYTSPLKIWRQNIYHFGDWKWTQHIHVTYLQFTIPPWTPDRFLWVGLSSLQPIHWQTKGKTEPWFILFCFLWHQTIFEPFLHKHTRARFSHFR